MHARTCARGGNLACARAPLPPLRSKEISEEVHSHRPLELLADMAYCPSLARVAVGGGGSVKLLDVGAEYGEVAGEGLELPPGHSVEKLGWGPDGQVRRRRQGSWC